MRRLLVILSVIFSVFLGISLATSDILDSSYSDLDSTTYTTFSGEHSAADNQNVTRTVISAVPKTGPSGSLIGVILSTLAIFGGYIYIKKRADI